MRAGTPLTNRPDTRRLPVIAIVGRPNVGKSTLFNRMVGRRIAVVEDTPGVTRDRLYAEAEWRGIQYSVVDTGGVLVQNEDPLIEQVRVQAQVAIEEADVILFVTDVVEGVTPADQELADLLRGSGKPIIVLPNKADNDKLWDEASEFYALNIGDVMPISSVHGSGIGDVLDKATILLPRAKSDEAEEEGIKLAIIGRPNVGKSSLINAITGETRVIVSDIPGTTRDPIDTFIEWDNHPITLIDTAGLRRPGKVQGSIEFYITLRAQRALDRADVAMVVIDGSEGLTDGDKRAARYAHERGRAMVWVVNKWDLVEPPDGNPHQRSDLKIEFAQKIADQMPSTAYASVAFVSALKHTGLDPMLDTAIEAADNHAFRISTGQLNRIIRDAVFERPPTYKGDPLKVYYATMPSTRPPTILLFVNNRERLHFSYNRYLENCIRREFPLSGTPLILKTKLSGGHERNEKKGKR
ncbi:MAG: ribosome biogenesis GTPase Der [bacterium]